MVFEIFTSKAFIKFFWSVLRLLYENNWKVFCLVLYWREFSAVLGGKAQDCFIVREGQGSPGIAAVSGGHKKLDVT